MRFFSFSDFFVNKIFTGKLSTLRYMNKADRVVILIRVLFWFQLHLNFDNCAIIDFDGRCWGCPPLNYNECSKYLDLIHFILPNPWPLRRSPPAASHRRPRRTRPPPSPSRTTYSSVSAFIGSWQFCWHVWIRTLTPVSMVFVWAKPWKRYTIFSTADDIFLVWKCNEETASHFPHGFWKGVPKVNKREKLFPPIFAPPFANLGIEPINRLVDF